MEIRTDFRILLPVIWGHVTWGTKTHPISLKFRGFNGSLKLYFFIWRIYQNIFREGDRNVPLLQWRNIHVLLILKKA